jgi:hypothetical protein
MESFIKQIDYLLTPEECQDFIQKFETGVRNNRDYQGNFNGLQKEYMDLHQYEDLKDFDNKIKAVADVEVQKFLHTHRTFMECTYYQESTLLLKLDAHVPLKLHYDIETTDRNREGEDIQTRHFAALIYLQDLPDGKLYFPMQKTLVDIRPGRMVIFPTFFTHPHTVFPSTVDRYAYRINYFVR